MPRKSKKNASKVDEALTVLADASTTARTKADSGFIKIDTLFHSYANKTSGVIDPEGIEKLCLAIGIKHTDVRILMFAWKVGAEKQGFFTKDEWRRGLKDLKVDTLVKLKNAVSELMKEVQTPPNFVNFYSYAFKYCLTEESKKTLDMESACVLLELVLGSQFRPQIDSIIEYLKVQKEYKGINLDQWTGFLRFCNQVSYPDLQNYDPTEAWPSILDSYVDWLTENNTK